MDSAFKFPGSPGTPLYQVSPERVNQQRPQSVYDESPNGLSRHSRESSVHDKVAVFNSLAYQGKQLERKTNDAALKRAMLGREEAESEMRRYREDVRALKRQVEEGQGRERKVMERLESVMVSLCEVRGALCYAFLLVCRKIMGEPRRPTRIHRLYGRKRFAERVRITLSLSLQLSSYRRS